LAASVIPLLTLAVTVINVLKAAKLPVWAEEGQHQSTIPRNPGAMRLDAFSSQIWVIRSGLRTTRPNFFHIISGYASVSFNLNVTLLLCRSNTGNVRHFIGSTPLFVSCICANSDRDVPTPTTERHAWDAVIVRNVPTRSIKPFCRVSRPESMQIPVKNDLIRRIYAGSSNCI